MSLPTVVDSSGTYDDRLNKVLKDGLDTWYSQLSKEDILQFIADRPQITADVLRDMMASYDLTIGFGTLFNTKEKVAVAHFEQPGQ